jgi:hypothetical protein
MTKSLSQGTPKCIRDVLDNKKNRGEHTPDPIICPGQNRYGFAIFKYFDFFNTELKLFGIGKLTIEFILFMSRIDVSSGKHFDDPYFPYLTYDPYKVAPLHPNNIMIRIRLFPY